MGRIRNTLVLGTYLLKILHFLLDLFLIVKVEAGACFLDTTQLPHWFSECGNSNMSEYLEQPWRMQILQDLKARLPLQDVFVNYEQAVDTTSWIHTGEARVNLATSSGYLDCLLQLEWVQTTGTLTIINPDGATTMVSKKI